MSNLARAMMMGAAGASGDPVYVDDVFSTYLYDGTGSAQTINNGIDLSGEGGLVWAKSRSSRNHIFSDTERGTGKVLFSNSNSGNDADATTITSYNSNGWTMGSSTLKMNTNGENFVSWTFRKAKGFFDVVTYTGNSSHRDISHNLGSEPGSIWIKRTDQSESWICYHRSLDQGGGSGATAHMAGLELESDGGQYGGTLRWSASGGGEDHTATTFHVSGHSAINGNGMTYVAYIFAHDNQSFGDDGDEAIIKCGSYTGNGTSSSSVNTISLGFEPQWVMIKRTSSSGDWVMLDTMRGFTAAGVDDEYLLANTNGAAGSFSQGSPTATGFQLQGNNGDTNGDAATFVYIAIRRPHKPPEAGTEVFKPELLSSLTQTSTPGFAPDLVWQRPVRNTSDNSFFVGNRLTGNGKYMQTFNDNTEGSFASWKFDAPTGKFSQTLTTGSTSGGLQYFFKRAAGFFDIVAYSGNSTSGRTVSHNLGVVPEMMWIKQRSGGRSWRVYDSSGATGAMKLSNEAAKDVNSNYFSTPTADNIILGNDQDTNRTSYDYIAYLFATLPGISKIGTFSGTGSDINVDCGFTAGARFVFIKRMDTSAGDKHWFQWDSARGIVAGNDPYVLIDNTAAEVTNTDYIDPLNAGFTVTASGNDNLNASGGTYLFFAIA